MGLHGSRGAKQRSADAGHLRELGAPDDIPVVHEFWRHHEAGVFVPSSERPVHTGKLITEVPFPVGIDLRSLVEV